ncbi:DinB family protein [Paenibacillus rhizovicinus]|uniref:DinB family protein n=1 Tax=Paenibacillus rhizovicinus TaxID=2704463 RepID=A0A6C0P455_9BACL|nr:DinB family protein [Paenibacillus rhizovicinus]QHW33237.1 DinB family protein [Paenibacillus rhizovicinus]
MTVKQSIAFIGQELSLTLNTYDEWFDLRSDMLSYKPHEGWSIEQILEHVTLTNYFLLILIRKGKKKALDLAAKADLAHAVANYPDNLVDLDKIAAHKSFKWIRPEHMEPTGEKTLSEVKALLQEQIHECIEILKDIPNGEGILYKTTMTVNNLGKIDVYQYIYFLCLHAKRHITQMQSVKDEFSESERGNR